MVKVFNLIKRNNSGKIKISENLSPDIGSSYFENLKISSRLKDEQFSVLKSICNTINTPFFSVDTECRYACFNNAHAVLMKQLYNAEIQLHQNALDFYTINSDRKKTKENLTKALQGNNFSIEDYFGGNGPNQRYFNVTYNVVYNNTNQIIGVTINANEIINSRNNEANCHDTFINYNSIIETSPLPIIITDHKGIVKLWNEAAESIFGWKKQEVIGKLSPFLPADKFEEAKAVRERVLSGETIKNFETERQTKNGNRIIVSFSASPFRSNNGNIIGLLAIVENITDRKMIEKELKVSNERFTKIFDVSPVPMLIADFKAGLIQKVNSSYEKLTEYSSSEIIGKSPFDLGIYENKEEVLHKFKIFKEQGKQKGFELSLRTKSGSIKTILAWSNTLQINEQSIINLGTALDITELRNAERIKAVVETQLKSVMDNLMEGCQIIDFNWKYIYLNDAAARDSHSEKSKLLNRTMMECFPGIEHTEMFSVLKECMKKRISRRIDNEFIYPDGTKGWFNLSVQPVPEGIFILSLDVTDQKIAETKFNTASERLKIATESAHIAIWDWDIANNNLVWDEQMYRLYGLKKEDFNGAYEAWLSGIHPDDREASNEISRRAVKGELEYDTEFRVLWPDQSVHWIKANANVFRNEKGEPVRMIGVNYDITGRKQAEIELHKSQENFSRTFEANPAALVISRLKNGQIIKINSAYTRIIGYSESEIIGTTGKDNNMFLEPKDRSVFLKLLNRDGAIRGMEIKLRVKSGDVRDMLIYLELIHFDNDECILSALIDITERKQAEVALKNSRESFSRTFESNPAALVITRLKDGKIIKINSTYSLTIGYQPEEIIGRYGSEFNIFADPGDRQALLETLQKNKTVKDYECRIRVKNGSIKNMIIFMEPIFFEEEDCILSALLDITARKQAEENLRESDERLQQIINQSQTVIWEIDARGMYTFVSPVSKNVWGYNPEELIGKKYYYDLHPELGRKIFKEQTQKIFDRKENFQNFINPIESGDGGIVWVVTNGVAITDENNKLIGYRGSDKDITELKNAENEIRILNEELEERIQERTAELADLYNNAPCGYHSIDANGLFELINDTELKWLGYNRNELIGKVNALGLLTEKSKQIFIENFPILKKQGSREDLELDFIRKDGSILSVLLNATAIHDKDGNFLRSRSTIIDHTQRKKAEELLREALTRLETANKELEAFSYSVSHDLRAPLRAIGGFAKILSDDYNQVLDQEGKRICDVISSSTEKMGKLIDDLLAFSRLGRSDIRFVHIDMEQMVRNIIADYYPNSDFNNTTFVVKKLPRVKGDIDMLKQVWINLISNAVKYSSKNQKSLVEIDYEDLENEIIYRIKDNGVGFEMQYVNKLFGVFQRLHNSKTFDGTGVGLAIVHRIIQRHSGRVWGEGIPNKGATFYFSLPKI